jgi:hypothetical protein
LNSIIVLSRVPEKPGRLSGKWVEKNKGSGLKPMKIKLWITPDLP